MITVVLWNCLVCFAPYARIRRSLLFAFRIFMAFASAACIFARFASLRFGMCLFNFMFILFIWFSRHSSLAARRFHFYCSNIRMNCDCWGSAGAFALPRNVLLPFRPVHNSVEALRARHNRPTDRPTRVWEWKHEKTSVSCVETLIVPSQYLLSWWENVLRFMLQWRFVAAIRTHPNFIQIFMDGERNRQRATEIVRSEYAAPINVLRGSFGFPHGIHLHRHHTKSVPVDWPRTMTNCKLNCVCVYVIHVVHLQIVIKIARDEDAVACPCVCMCKCAACYDLHRRSSTF